MLPQHLKARIKSPAQMVEKMMRDFNRYHQLADKPFHRLSKSEQSEYLKLRRLRRGVL